MKHLPTKVFYFLAYIFASFIFQNDLFAKSDEVNIVLHLRGVYQSDISLMALLPNQRFKSISTLRNIRNGVITTLIVKNDLIPGEFVLRFEYKENEDSKPYPSEKRIFIGKQDVELWVNPTCINNPDSTWFQEGELENAAFELFSKENKERKKSLGLLQQFLVNYDETKSDFYQKGTKEFERRRQIYNSWLDSCSNVDKSLFVSSTYSFQYVPKIPWEGQESERTKNVIGHYFDGIDFNNPMILKTSQMNEWMNSYVNLYGQLVTTKALGDSLFPAAASNAIEKAKHGSPIVYGWMVDYFYRGFESNDIPKGMKALEPFLSDTNCLTSKRMEINRRLKGMESLIKGSKAPDILLKDSFGEMFQLNNFETSAKYILLLFWSADCTHCKETIGTLYPWQSQPEILQKMSIVAVSLDETATEVQAWDQKIKELTGWKHIRAIEGVRSKVASDYFVLATPTMILLDAKTKEIISLPTTFSQLKIDIAL